VLYSMSSADSSKWKQISAALEQAFNVDVLRGQAGTSIDDTSMGNPAPPIDNLIQNNEVPQVARVQAAIQSVIDQTNRNGGQQQPEVTVGTDREGVVIRLSGSYLFDSGRAELKPNSFALLDAIAGQLKLEPNDIRVDGHTDSTPLIGSALYPTNWELSTARALAVTRYLTETDGIQATRMEAAGYGEFRPIVPNDIRENRALNRRVEIHLLSTSPDDHALPVATPQISTGVQTPTGAQASTGPQGSSGAQASTGSQTPTGLQSSSGQSSSGAQSSSGQSSSAAQSSLGAQSSSGAQASAGVQTPTGPQSSSGAQSSSGQSSSGPQSSSGAEASNGSQHSTGSQDPPPPSQTATEHSQQ
jgi:chemotaxis protein MotB